MCVLGYRYDGAKRTTFGSSFWNNEKQARNSLSRRDVPTSRRRVNHAEVSDIATSRHRHVATSPCRDVTTSRRQLENLHLIIKCQTARKLGHREAYDQRHEFREPEDPDFERLPGIRTASILLDIIEDIMMMFLILDILFFSFMMF